MGNTCLLSPPLGCILSGISTQLWAIIWWRVLAHAWRIVGEIYAACWLFMILCIIMNNDAILIPFLVPIQRWGLYHVWTIGNTHIIFMLSTTLVNWWLWRVAYNLAWHLLTYWLLWAVFGIWLMYFWNVLFAINAIIIFYRCVWLDLWASLRYNIFS